MKMGELARLNQKALWFVIASAVILGILLGEFFSINRFYRDGARDFGQGMAGVMDALYRSMNEECTAYLSHITITDIETQLFTQK